MRELNRDGQDTNSAGGRNYFIEAPRSPLQRETSTHLFETTVISSDKGHDDCQEERSSSSVCGGPGVE